MEKKLNCRTVKENFTITELLAKLGHQPKKSYGDEVCYISPIREKEKTPSFFVNTITNQFFDHGTGVGGDIIKLAQLVFNTNNISVVLDKLTFMYQSDVLSFSQQTPPINSHLVSFPPTESSKIEIGNTKEIGNSKTVTDYILSRGISLKTAEAYCKEVSFTIRNKSYWAIGFQNQSGGYELRNDWFKGSSSPKDITFLDNDSKSVCLLEGFTDFLSLMELKKQAHPGTNFLILNSVNLLSKSIDLLEKHQDVFLLLDNDKAGKETVERLKNYGIKSTDSSGFYQGFKDVNEYLLSTIETKRNRSFR